VGKKDGKDKKTKAKTKKTNDPEDGGKSKKSKSKSSKSKSKPKTDENADPQEVHAQGLRLSTSSFEVGALDTSPVVSMTLRVSLAATALGAKKQSILGLGLPSTIRLPRVRNGSSASSVLIGAGPAPAFTAATTTSGIVVGTAMISASLESALNHASNNNNHPPRPSSIGDIVSPPHIYYIHRISSIAHELRSELDEVGR